MTSTEQAVSNRGRGDSPCVRLQELLHLRPQLPTRGLRWADLPRPGFEQLRSFALLSHPVHHVVGIPIREEFRHQLLTNRLACGVVCTIMHLFRIVPEVEELRTIAVVVDEFPRIPPYHPLVAASRRTEEIVTVLGEGQIVPGRVPFGQQLEHAPALAPRQRRCVERVENRGGTIEGARPPDRTASPQESGRASGR